MGKRPGKKGEKRQGWAARIAVIVAAIAAALGLTVVARRTFGKRPG